MVDISLFRKSKEILTSQISALLFFLTLMVGPSHLVEDFLSTNKMIFKFFLFLSFYRFADHKWKHWPVADQHDFELKL